MAERGELFARGFIRAYTDRITELEAENLALQASSKTARGLLARLSDLADEVDQFLAATVPTRSGNLEPGPKGAPDED